MSAARRRKGKPKKPLGRKAALEPMALQLGADIIKKQPERAALPPACDMEPDAETDGQPKYVSPALEAKRRFA